ncbi:Tetratricopeptide TPR_2 repeat protein [Anaeromyxobacter sp. K]|uniref:tetratricopeptide repeat protein n=1 Tax=Anaeromyxobacter sp. (strain K) TaxID=447217 RepID=UPI00015F8A4A|nr:tetratricopeptide repeat protein [Anaeromyxobacter sp. K]ACG74134.1 Tetratricopeptide TPR_2 repeat protein [Anaeromyxobacter sp. K]
MIRRAGLVALLALCACAGAGSRSRPLDEARLAVARAMVEHRAWNDALLALDRYHASAGPCAESLTLRGVALRERGVHEEARADFEHALRLDGRWAPAHAALAVLHDVDGAYDEGERHHRKALELAPRNASYWNDYGFALFARGRNDKALQALRKAVELEPTLRRARTNLGFAYARAGDFTRASQQFDLAEPPAEARNNLGVAYEAAGLLAPAYDAYLAAVRADPGLARARANLADVARSLGRALPADVATGPVAGGG